MLSGQNASPRWSTDRIRAERIDEYHSLPRQPIDIRSLVDLGTICANGLQRMIVGEDHDNVWPSVSGQCVKAGRPSEPTSDDDDEHATPRLAAAPKDRRFAST
jgi:hypothetical protein